MKAVVVTLAVILGRAAAEVSGAVTVKRGETSNGADSEVTANPIRKVVTMLQGMQKKITAEAEKEKELYDKFMCYCKNGASDLQSSIAGAKTKMPQLQADIEKSTAQLAQLKEDLKSHQADRSAAKEAMAKATAIREKEAKAFAAEKASLDADIDALAKSIVAIEKGMSG